MISREPCGCRHNGTEWLEMCPTHRAEHDETHARWQCEHVERQKRDDPATRYL
jgi:hypothetical protein